MLAALVAGSLARVAAASAEPYAIVIASTPEQGAWYQENQDAPEQRIVSLPLALPRTARVRVEPGATLLLSLPRGRVTLEAGSAPNLEELNLRQPPLPDPGNIAARHFLMGGGRRGPRTLIALPAEMSAVRPASFAVELSAHCPPGPAKLELSDARRHPLRSEVFARAAGETVLESDAFQAQLATLRGQAAWLRLEADGRSSEVLIQVIPEADEAKLGQELAAAEAEAEPLFRHLRRAYLFEKRLLLREAYGELLSAADAARGRYPALANVAADFAARRGFSPVEKGSNASLSP